MTTKLIAQLKKSIGILCVSMAIVVFVLAWVIITGSPPAPGLFWTIIALLVACLMSLVVQMFQSLRLLYQLRALRDGYYGRRNDRGPGL